MVNQTLHKLTIIATARIPPTARNSRALTRKNTRNSLVHWMNESCIRSPNLHTCPINISGLFGAASPV